MKEKCFLVDPEISQRQVVRLYFRSVITHSSTHAPEYFSINFFKSGTILYVVNDTM